MTTTQKDPSAAQAARIGNTADTAYRQGIGMMLGLVKKATKRRDNAQDAWQHAIRDAVEAGASLRAVAEAAGISHVRVLQITRG